METSAGFTVGEVFCNEDADAALESICRSLLQIPNNKHVETGRGSITVKQSDLSTIQRIIQETLVRNQAEKSNLEISPHKQTIQKGKSVESMVRERGRIIHMQTIRISGKTLGKAG